MSPKYRKIPIIKKALKLSLIEVLISFFLISMALIPLAYPHALALIEEKKFSLDLKAERDANLLFGSLIHDLYENKIPPCEWESQNREFPVSQMKMEEAGITAPFPKVSIKYSSKHKPKKGPSILYLVKAEFEIAYPNIHFFGGIDDKPRIFPYTFTVMKERREDDSLEDSNDEDLNDETLDVEEDE